MYVYAFLPSSVVPLELPDGIESPVQLIAEAGLTAVVEEGLNLEHLQQSDNRLMQAVLLHDRVIRELFSQTALLPLRFGTHFVSKEALVSHLQANGRSYLELLHHLADKAEYTLKLTPLDPPEEEEATSEGRGRDYFLAKKRRFQAFQDHKQQQQDELEQIKEAIAQMYPGAVYSAVKDDVERVHLFVPRRLELALLEQLSEWQGRSPHWQVELSEALPPYHFV